MPDHMADPDGSDDLEEACDHGQDRGKVQEGQNPNDWPEEGDHAGYSPGRLLRREQREETIDQGERTEEPQQDCQGKA